ncbi:DsbA family oxidoreductase [Oceanobacillus luteolus]|uniref:DsbA family protein n=1 Tax=Oceanobacillus luteolus TaxID=1274358 RepID=A0ABW4HW41_9BACI|nr:DsbA family oxidoreductase [Oceanobacillus luteolus]MCM3741300.1 DsbA family oxidoreductase [Oceanobacillus luteolus]
MKITIWSDFMCPFCYIGEAHLEKALEEFEHADKVEIEYKSFLLSPEAAHNPQKDYYETFADMKGIPVDQAKGMFENVVNMAKDADLVIDYDTAKFASTIPAHHVFQYAKEQGKGNEFFKRFYKAHFTEGELLSDTDTIGRLAEEVGIDKYAALGSTQNQSYTQKVNQDIQEASQIGVQGVPFYVFNNKYAVSGAQPVAQFKQVLEQVWQEETEQ